MNRMTTAAGCAALGWLIAQPAMAACSLSTQPIPVKMLGDRPMIDAKVNGKTAHFLLDSGTAVNMMNSKFAASQKLAPTKTSAGGPSVVTAPQFELAGAALKDVPFVASDGVPDADGVVGQTFLHQGDAEYDLGSGPAASVKLAKAVGCEGSNMAYWAKDGDVFFEAELTPATNGAPLNMTTVVINGVKLRGLLSTGNAYTTITTKAAAKVGVKTTDPGVSSLNAGKAWRAPFNSVIVGNEETKNTPLQIAETNDDFYDVLIGADFFSAHHVYVANSQQKIYFTRSPAAQKVFKVPQPIGMKAGPTAGGRLQDHFSPGSSGGTKD